MARPPKRVVFGSAVAPRLALAGEEPPEPPRPGFLVVIHGPDVGRKYDLFLGMLSIGRAEDCAIFLREESLSRWHASVVVDGEGVWIEGHAKRCGRNRVSGAPRA